MEIRTNRNVMRQDATTGWILTLSSWVLIKVSKRELALNSDSISYMDFMTMKTAILMVFLATFTSSGAQPGRWHTFYYIHLAHTTCTRICCPNPLFSNVEWQSVPTATTSADGRLYICNSMVLKFSLPPPPLITSTWQD